MKKDALPKPVAACIDALFDGREIRLIEEADLGDDGRFGRQWLVATDRSLAVLTDSDGHARARHVIAFDAVTSIEAVNLVGRGMVEAVTAGGLVRLVSYSNARSGSFFKAVDAIKSWKEGKPYDLDGKKDEGQKKCDVCGDPVPEDMTRCPKCVHKGKTFLRILDFARPYISLLALLFLFMLLTTGFQLVTPYISKLFIDYILKPDAQTGLFTHGAWLIPAVLLMLLSHTAELFLGGLHERVSGSLGYKTVYDVRAAVYEKLQMLSLSFFDKHQTGALLARVNQDTGELQRFIVDFFPLTLESLLLLAGVGIFLFMLSWQITLFVFIPIVATLWFLRKIWPRLHTFFHRYFHRRSRLSAFVNDSLSGIRVIKAFGQEDSEIAKFDRRSSSYRDAGIDLVKKWSVYHPILHFFIMTGGVIVWLVGGRLVLDHKMTLGSIVAYSGYLALFYRPVFVLSRMMEMITNSLSAAERVFDVIDTDPAIKDSADAVAMPKISGKIEFSGVSFGYSSFEPVIKDLTMKVDAFEKVGLVGKSGAGKSTIINLICRLYDVDKGGILVDGVDIRNIRYADLRRQIGVVLQEAFLFNGTIYENLSYARPGATREEVIAAAIAANAHEFIVRKPDGYDTEVGERGNRLSGGEKQRISIARAILRNPAILILDEATSSVDTETEMKIQKAFDNLTKNRTTIAIAHRLSTLRNYDRLFVIEDGSLKETGTHGELMAKQGTFHNLVKMQQEMSQIIIGGEGKKPDEHPEPEHD